MKETKEIINDYGIKVGTPCTYGCWTDAYPGMVVRVTKKLIFVKPVEHGNKVQWPDQDWDVYLDKPVGKEMQVSNTKRGFRSPCYSFSFGHARYYLDPSF
jgi:hypothetical protein